MKSRYLSQLCVAAIVSFFTATTVFAQEIIHACSKIENGQLRIVNNPTDCLLSEKPISWEKTSTSTTEPLEILVDCENGDSIMQALSDAPLARPLVITLHGVCEESIYIERDNVTIQGDTPESGIKAPSNYIPAITQNSSHGIYYNNFSITGGDDGIRAIGGKFNATDIRVTSTNSYGIAAVGISSCVLNNTTIDMSGINGIISSSNCSVRVFGGVISNSQSYGVTAVHGGHVYLGSGVVIRNNSWGVKVAGSSQATLGEGAQVINNNNGGIDIMHGGSVVFYNGATIKNNGSNPSDGHGIQLSGGSSVSIGQNIIIDSNAGHGIYLLDTSVVNWINNFESIISNNGGYGINCASSLGGAQISGTVGTVINNTLGQIHCP